MSRTEVHISTSVIKFIHTQTGHFSAIKILLGFCLLMGVVIQLQAQDTNVTSKANTVGILLQGKLVSLITTSSDYSFLSNEQKRKRTKIIAATNIIGYSSAMVGLYAAWYKNYPQSNFHTFNDIGEWKGIDKIGHAYSAYAESKASMELWRWTGIDRKKRIWLGGMSGAFYQTVIETLDGFSSEWGWSWGDFSANVLGSGMLVAQELAWDEQRIQFKFSFHRKTYKDPTLIQRSNKIFGSSTAERFLKDYNGQTYWLSANLKSFFPESKLPGWLNVAAGTGAEGMFGANENIGKDANGNINFNRTDIKRYRQWYLAPDIDLTKIKTNKKGIKVALNILNIVKFPMPSLEYSNGRFKVNVITF
jgi:fluoride ion exporter CrcB/FEX